MTADFILDALRLIQAKGTSVSEAVAQFSREDLSKAIFDGSGEINPTQRALWEELTNASQEKQNERDLGQAIELWMAGWTHEPVTPRSRIMSWYWRAPAKGKRPLGRRYLSTQQALNALHRQQNAVV